MNSKPVIQVAGLGKRYRLGELETYRSLREAIPATARRLLRRVRKPAKQAPQHSEFWALRDISFEVKQGDVLGIIGHNGAGKSTLLKILSRITEPTEGYARLRGRVSSLLEVGTGFHPELSGRENVYLNGSILGMTKREIDRKFDAIVDFSGVEKFLDTPVKRYSSGMSVRLAFAVAAHLEPEVLIIDEVLAVGDAEFQSRCLGKMEDVAKSGRTVLFVSHNMAAVEALCTQAMLLSRGGMLAQGKVSDVIDSYLSRSTTVASDIDLSNHSGRPSSCRPIIRRLRILDSEGSVLPALRVGGDATFELTMEADELHSQARVVLEVEGPRGERLFALANHIQHGVNLDIQGRMTISAHLRNCRLAPGRYRMRPKIRSRGKILDSLPDGLSFDVVSADVYGTGRLPPAKTGPFVPEVTWDYGTPVETAS